MIDTIRIAVFARPELTRSKVAKRQATLQGHTVKLAVFILGETLVEYKKGLCPKKRIY